MENSFLSEKNMALTWKMLLNPLRAGVSMILKLIFGDFEKFKIHNCLYEMDLILMDS
jgi:hypothetical protein